MTDHPVLTSHLMYFIHRDWEAGPLCKSVRHVPGRTVLEWFRGLWEPGGLDRAHSDLNGAPYVLEWLRECGDTPPENMVELRRRIRMQLGPLPPTWPANGRGHGKSGRTASAS